MKLRILFEQKLNSLHLINMEADTRAIMYKDKLERMELNYVNEQILIKELREDIDKLEAYKIKASQLIKV